MELIGVVTCTCKKTGISATYCHDIFGDSTLELTLDKSQ